MKFYKIHNNMIQEKLFKILQWYENTIKQEPKNEVCKLIHQIDGEKGTGSGSLLGQSFVN